MKCLLVVLLGLLGLWVLISRGQERELDTRAHRITQLGCALAQAHAENDTLEVMLENMDARTGGGARWLR